MSAAAMAESAARKKNDFDVLFIEGLRAFRAWISVWRIGPRNLVKVPDARSVSQVECREGEVGVKGVELWMEDGTRITTGDDGKFSLPNVKPGQHVLRVNE